MDYKGPAFIRYPRGSGLGVPIKEHPKSLKIGTSKRTKQGTDIDIWALGSMHEMGEKLAHRLSEHDIQAGLVNARFVKPLDRDALIESAKEN